jgi:hypothetical protein
MASFILSPAGLSDLPDLIRIAFAAFAPNEGFRALFGPDNPRSHASVTARLQRPMEADPSDFWIKASTPEGKVIGAINYKIHLHWSEEDSRNETEEAAKVDIDWQDDDESKACARDMLVAWMEGRERYIKEPHISEFYIESPVWKCWFL